MLGVFDGYSYVIARSSETPAASQILNTRYNSTISFGVTFTLKPQELYNETAQSHVVFQVIMIFVTLAFAIAGGIVSGCVLKLFGMLSKTTIDEADQYQDKTTFVVPSDFPE